MADFQPINTDGLKKKSFWRRPEGVTGTIFMLGLIAGGGYLLVQALPALLAAASNLLYLSGMLLVLAAVIYMVLDPRMRNLVWYGYKSIMRWITGIFVTIDPIGILKNYVDDMEDNLRKLSTQIGAIKGQMRKLSTIMSDNTNEINNSMKMASMAKQKGNDKQVILNSRKAARLKESNAKIPGFTFPNENYESNPDQDVLQL